MNRQHRGYLIPPQDDTVHLRRSLLEQEHRALTLNVANSQCSKAILDFVEYALTATLLAIPGFPSTVAPLVAKALVANLPASAVATAIDGLIQKQNPTPADYATTFASIVTLVAQGGYLTPAKVGMLLTCFSCRASR